MLTAESRLRDFPSLENRSYFNSAAEGILPVTVTEALAQYAQDKLLGMDGRALHEAQWAAAQSELASFYSLTSDEVSFCSCSSEAFNLAALALQLKEGDEVVINNLDFPAAATPWLQPTCPAEVKVWKAKENGLHAEDLEKLLTRNTRLVTVSLVSFYNGFKIDLAAVRDVIRKNSNALLALDVTQALGRIPLDLTDVDLIVSSTHKWILASHGGGLVGVPKHRKQEWTVPAGGWFNLKDAFEADRFERIENKAGAASFSVGMPNYPAIYTVRAGLEYIRKIGVEKIDEHCRPLVEMCYAELQKMDVDLITPAAPENRAGIMAFLHRRAEEIYNHLHNQNIHVMYHAGRIRIAIHGYNTVADVERLLKALREALKAC